MRNIATMAPMTWPIHWPGVLGLPNLNMGNGNTGARDSMHTGRDAWRDGIGCIKGRDMMHR